VTRLQTEFSWSRTENGVYSARSAYNTYFLGAVQAGYANLLWKSWAPLKEKVFTWLALRDRCWTGDRLSKRRMARPARCLLCDQRTETLNHLMVQCPTSRYIWYHTLEGFGLQRYTPQADSKFRVWWCGLNACQPKEKRLELAMLSIACCRRLWLDRNSRNFNRKTSTEETLIRLIREEISVVGLCSVERGISEWGPS
jgi:hypothetical protein